MSTTEGLGLFTAEDLNHLRHMLGVGNHIRKSAWGFRNHFAAGGKDVASMARLEAAGLVVKGRPFGDRASFYHATERGCSVAGLTAAQTRKCLERG